MEERNQEANRKAKEPQQKKSEPTKGSRRKTEARQGRKKSKTIQGRIEKEPKIGDPESFNERMVNLNLKNQ